MPKTCSRFNAITLSLNLHILFWSTLTLIATYFLPDIFLSLLVQYNCVLASAVTYSNIRLLETWFHRRWFHFIFPGFFGKILISCAWKCKLFAFIRDNMINSMSLPFVFSSTTWNKVIYSNLHKYLRKHELLLLSSFKLCIIKFNSW